MKYEVIVTPEAQANVAAAYRYIAEHSPMNAAKWVGDLYAQIDGLERFPRRFEEAREQSHVKSEIRQIAFKSHRVIFAVDDARRKVYVVFVRHAKMRAVGESAEMDDGA